MSEMNDETTPAYVVCVQSSVDQLETEWYWLDPGDEPIVESNDDRELWINKLVGGDTNDVEFVAVYGTDMWVRAWVAEYDPDEEEAEE